MRQPGSGKLDAVFSCLDANPVTACAALPLVGRFFGEQGHACCFDLAFRHALAYQPAIEEID